MTRLTMAAAALSFVVASAAIHGQQPAPTLPEALDGVDVVILVQQGKEVFGKSAYRSSHGNLDYLFSTAQTKAEFERAPEKYAAQFGGTCARMGSTVSANPSDYVLHDGKIYLFGSDACRKAFTATPEKFIPRAATPWPAGDLADRGRALLDKAAAGHGGAAVDAARTYTAVVKTIQKRPTGDVTVIAKTMWRFPGSVRTDRIVPLANGGQTFTSVFTPTGAWGSGMGRVAPAPPATEAAARAAAFRSLLPILKMRKDRTLKAAALEPATVNGVSVERVRVALGQVDVTLNLDPATGRTHSMSYYERADQGQWADILITFDDYRTIDGVQVPFVENATANGAPLAQLTRTLDSVAINVPLDPALFVMPPGAGQ